MRVALGVVLVASVALAFAVNEQARNAARLTLVRTVEGALPFFNPAMGVKGVLEPATGHRLQIVEILVGETPFESEVAAFVLTTADGVRHAAVAAGGGFNLTFPLARIPVGRDVGQLLPNDTIVAVKRNTQTSVTIDADPLSTIALVFDVPVDAILRTLVLPDGAILSLAR